MALINVGASFPQYMWAVTRLLLASDGKLAEKDAKLLLTPPSLTAGENDEYNVAVKTLADLDIVTRSDGIVALGGEARTLFLQRRHRLQRIAAARGARPGPQCGAGGDR